VKEYTDGNCGRASNTSPALVHEHIKEIGQVKNARFHPSGRHLLRIMMGQMPKVSFDEPVDGPPLTPNCGLGLLGGTKESE